MAITVDVPGLGTIEFPDGMSEAQISAEVRKLTANLPKQEAALALERQEPGTSSGLSADHHPGSAPPPPKSPGGFLANALMDLPAVPKTIWDTAQLASKYTPGTVSGTTNMVQSLADAFGGRKPADPAGQAGAAIGQNPASVAGAIKEKVTNPGRTAGELVDYGYNRPISAAMDLSGLLAGGAGALKWGGKAPRLASALATASRVTDPVNVALQGTGGLSKIAGSGGEAVGEGIMRKALNMSDADVRARGGAERTALLNRVSGTEQGDAKLSRILAPIGQRQQAAIDAMPEFVVSHDQLPRLNTLVDETEIIRGSHPARYDEAVKNRTEALTDPNWTNDRPVIDGMAPTEGRYPAPVSGQVLHKNKRAIQERAAAAQAYLQHPDPKAEAAALKARGADYRQLLNDASPEYAAANAEFEPLMALQEQIRLRALPRGGREIPYAAGIGLQAARGQVLAPAMGIVTSLALKNPRVSYGLAQGAFDVGRGLGAAGSTTQFAAPAINRLDALQRAILRQRANQDGR